MPKAKKAKAKKSASATKSVKTKKAAPAKKPTLKADSKKTTAKKVKVEATPKKGGKLTAKVSEKIITETTLTVIEVKGGKALKGAPKNVSINVKGAKGTVALNPKLNAKSPKTEKMALSGTPICREIACELAATTKGYCRLHYIKNWAKIQRKEQILKEKKLNQYIEELVCKYPDKYIEAIRQDLSSEKDFAKVITDLEIEEDMDDFIGEEQESAENIVESIRRDFDDDDGDIF